jgi:hypothetical protein
VIDGLACVGAGGSGDNADETLIPGRANFKGLSVDPFLAAKQKAGLCAWAHLHGVALPISTKVAPFMVKLPGGSMASKGWNQERGASIAFALSLACPFVAGQFRERSNFMRP